MTGRVVVEMSLGILFWVEHCTRTVETKTSWHWVLKDVVEVLMILVDMDD